ncbi:N-acetylglutamate synthase-like GNAT family acetyltransferase [Pseudoduganella flava]|uniref:GNAT family N-acetyltransferase n=1 Tax=Pseudoduganella flava TaxID=871742 RepID=A0A562PSY3_9BURK|nr:GNAT family N-acetyltransferase [Pseudoduganella flava]QGZ39161.1 GNAT family N-acetyltransferase [Pseudoduganella flava]TWI47551.1 N-acetylglutamate synthase-like GNAT family acetyltransferase [Pseudoduganella flava]
MPDTASFPATAFPATSSRAPLAIRHAELPRDLPIVRELFREYAAELGVDLCFQNFEEELATLPGKYAAPRGRILIAWDGDSAAGCVALRPVDAERGEMKRLYVRPAYRARKLGRALAERICDEARAAGYREICLDTLATMQAAVGLYEQLGFRPIGPYVHNPLEGVLFLGRVL